ncbi:hypothetical protein EJB05_16882 [Eragrostis curvula]|uniref:DUF2039 domain-containing protein n=1 Tax=Eragrostis curvula TaxID=38414 RepID=A0A5J9VHQ3_9POAL|nr:hypothetical protein EJB05_16882 [Eragrostis curvula]
MSKRQGPPKHQNSYAWKPNLGRKINETEPGGRFRPLSEITGVCQRCRDQIDWKRRYGKYKPIVEPAKCQKCSKRNVRQAYHNVCRDCSKNLGICAKCCTNVKELVGRDVNEEEDERKALDEAIRGARERERRTLLRIVSTYSTLPAERNLTILPFPLFMLSLMMNWLKFETLMSLYCIESNLQLMNKDKGKGGESASSVPKIADRSREGDLFPVASLDEYAEQAAKEDDDDDSDEEARDFVEE